MDNNKVEIPHQSNQAEKDKSKFNWVTERSACSLPKVFHTLRLQVEEDVKTRNTQRPQNSPYEFSVKDSGSDFSVLYKAKDLSRSVIFTLAEKGILVRGGEGNQMFEITVTFTPQGECKLIVNEEPRDVWQVRRMALEELFFHAN